jgi:hypothetical protein
MRQLRSWTPFLATLGLTLAGCSACRPPPLAAATPSPATETSAAAYACGSPGQPCLGQLCQLRGDCAPLQRPQFCLARTSRCTGYAAAGLIPVAYFF